MKNQIKPIKVAPVGMDSGCTLNMELLQLQ